MPYWAVSSGNILRCVLADDATSACVIAVTQHIKDETAGECQPGEIFEAAPFGAVADHYWYVSSEYVLTAGGFVLEKPDDPSD